MDRSEIITLLAIAAFGCAISQDTYVSLNQGSVVGLKVFPESSRTPVYTFLGIPYAQPPVEKLRFATPKPHGGWNQTFYAREFKPICPQLTNSIYDENTDRLMSRPPLMDEDCLYLNIWVPESGLRYGNLPVLVIITGEEMSFDWPQNRPSGLDLASEGVVVITVQYRTNIFGWLGLNSNELPGNLGFYDQQLALKWVQHNIHKFGGNPMQVTLLGHGTTGAVCGLIHLVSPKSEGLFSKAILMSGTTMAIKQIKLTAPKKSPSHQIVEKLGCQYNRGVDVSNCLRLKSTSDLLKAFETIYRHGNYTEILGPVIDSFRLPNEQSINISPDEAMRTGKCRRIPILIGLCTNEGAFIRDYWIDLAREGSNSLKTYINHTTIPLILSKYMYPMPYHAQVHKTISWRYFDQYPMNPVFILNSLQTLVSEAEFEAPFYSTIELLAQNLQNSTKFQNEVNIDSPNLFVYTLELSNSMDMRGKVNLFGGASHSSDLPLLMGPSLFQQIARRRFTSSEDKLCRRFRQLLTDFMKTGHPTPGRIYDAWRPYTTDVKFIKILGETRTIGNDGPMTNFEQNLPEIEEMLQKSAGSSVDSNQHQHSEQLNPYQLSEKNVNYSDSRRGRNSYLINKKDYEYYLHLKKVYSFWNVLLPSIYASSIESNLEAGYTERTGREITFMDNEATKYKHAFFSMLTIVCLLLGILGVCVYILKKNHPSLNSNL